MKKYFFILLLFSLSDSILYSQNKVYQTKCETAIAFLNLPNILSHFTLSNMADDSTIFLIDVDNLLEKCNLKTWNGYRIILYSSGPIVDTIKNKNIFQIRTRRRNFLIFQTGRINNRLYYNIFQPTSNGNCNANISRTKNGYFIKNLKCGWF